MAFIALQNIGICALGRIGCLAGTRAILERDIALEHPTLKRTSPDDPAVLPWVLSAAGFVIDPLVIAVGGAGVAVALTAYHLGTRFALKGAARMVGVQLPFKSKLGRVSLAVAGGVADLFILNSMFSWGLRLDYSLAMEQHGVEAGAMVEDWEAFQRDLIAKLGDGAMHQPQTQLDAFVYFYRQRKLQGQAFCRVTSANWSLANKDSLGWVSLFYMIVPLSALSYLFLPLQARCLVNFAQLQMLFAMQNQWSGRPVLGNIALEVRQEVEVLGTKVDA